MGEKTPYFANVCSPDRDAYAGDIPDIDKFPHWFEPKNSRVQAPEWYDANLVDGASYNSDNYLNKPYHGIAGVGTWARRPTTAPPTTSRPTSRP